MAERSTISQAVQIGVEATAGTAVAAPRRLGSIGVEMGISTDIKIRRPIGQKYPNLAVVGKEWMEADVSGNPVYTELPYLFSMIIGKAIRNEVQSGEVGAGDVLADGEIGPDGTGGAATKWTFTSSTFAPDAVKTLTMEQGDSVRAHRSAYCMLTDLTINWSREDVELDGTIVGRRIEDGITLTASPNMLKQIPVRPSELSVFLDAASGDLGDTKLLRVISGEFSIGGRFSPMWVVDASQDSFITHVETEPEVTFKMTQQANAEGMGNLVTMRKGDTVFLRLAATGPRINTGGDLDADAAIRHEMIIDMAGMVSETNSFSDEDGVYAMEWTFRAVYNEAWNNAFRVVVVTTLGAL